MCGIAGQLQLDNTPISLSLIKQMVQLQKHRGPDGDGIFIDDGRQLRWTRFDRKCEGRLLQGSTQANSPSLALGHCRLAILDLSSSGHQPMSDASGRYWITYNGEIYNYIELRKELMTNGYIFTSNTDTEVILAAYIRWGKECLNRFNGMWAFAIWDVKERELFCARDRFGVKPFYYFWNDKTFIFASEIKAVIHHSSVPRSLNDQVILDYLLTGNIDHLPGQTFFSEVYQLLPGHYVTLKDSSLAIRQYWEMRMPEKKKALTPELVAECRELLIDATRLRLRSDVSVGGTLSGGIDSTTLTCFIDQRLTHQPYHVFSTQFAGHPQDESKYVDDVMAAGRHLQLHTTLPKYQDLLDDLGQLMWHQDEPFGDTSIYAHYRLMGLARECGIKVVLTGQGADEIFSGYGSYYRAWLGQLLAKCKFTQLQREIQARAQLTGETQRSLYQAAIYHALPAKQRTWIQSTRLYRRADWIRQEFKQGIQRERFSPVLQGWEPFSWYLYESLTKWSVPHLVHHDDRNSMAFGVESRAPYLDYRLVQFLFSTVDEAKHSDGRMKVLLRKAGEGIIPSSVTARDDKIGFFTPMAQWLMNGREFIEDLLATDFAKHNPYFSKQRLVLLVSDLFAGNLQNASYVWWGLSLCLWNETVVQQHSVSHRNQEAEMLKAANIGGHS